MKKIKIFLASSIEDLKEDRLQVGDFFRQLNEIYLDSGIHFSLIKCEDYDNAIAARGKQSEYDREIKGSDLVFFLFFRKVGDYTKHEFDIALESFKSQEKPKIITYFKYVSSISEANDEVQSFMQLLDGELKHYYNTYGHIDTLKLGILMQIKLMNLDTSEVKLQDGEVLLNGNHIVKTANVPFLNGNKTLQELTKKKCELQAMLSERRIAYLNDPSKSNEDAFFIASAELNQVSKKLTEIEKETLEFMSTIAVITSDSKVLTYRQKEALKCFNQGDYDKAQAILSDKERENELERAKNRALLAKNEIQGYVNEDLLWIKTEKTRGVTKDNAGKIKEKYEKAVALCETYDLDKNVMYEYAAFLEKQNDYCSAIQIAETLKSYYEKASSMHKEVECANLYNLLGNLYYITDRFSDAEEIYGKALDIRNKLALHNPEAYELDLAITYNDLGVLYIETQCFKKTEDMYNKALEIKERLSGCNPEVYEPDLAVTYHNFGVLYVRMQHYKEAEDMFSKALEIYKRFAERNSEEYEPALAIIYDNLGFLYEKTQRYKEAEDMLNKALEISKRFAERNPEAYGSYLANTYNTLGILYDETQHYKEAEEMYNKALEIYKRFAERNPEAYGSYLATAYQNLGALYKGTQCYKEAEEIYIKAIEIRKRLTERNLEVYEPALAVSYYTLGFLYDKTQRYKEAEDMYNKALEIRKRLAERDPEVYEPDLADTYHNLGVLYANTQRHKEAENMYNKVLELKKLSDAPNPVVQETCYEDMSAAVKEIQAQLEEYLGGLFGAINKD